MKQGSLGLCSRPPGGALTVLHAGKGKAQLLLLCTIENSGERHVKSKQMCVKHGLMAAFVVSNRMKGKGTRCPVFAGAPGPGNVWLRPGP